MCNLMRTSCIIIYNRFTKFLRVFFLSLFTFSVFTENNVPDKYVFGGDVKMYV